MLYVTCVVMITPRFGMALTAGSVLFGQVIMALTLDHFGLLGNPVHSLNGLRRASLVPMVGGMRLIKRF